MTGHYFEKNFPTASAPPERGISEFLSNVKPPKLKHGPGSWEMQKPKLGWKAIIRLGHSSIPGFCYKEKPLDGLGKLSPSTLGRILAILQEMFTP